jgi:hypothetical protein
MAGLAWASAGLDMGDRFLLPWELSIDGATTLRSQSSARRASSREPPLRLAEKAFDRIAAGFCTRLSSVLQVAR